jgi:hypothetical protein
VHTPTPWHIGMKPGPTVYGPKGEQIVNPHNVLMDDAENRANALHIVMCVNAHAELVEAIKQIREAFYVGGTRAKLLAAIQPTKELLTNLNAWEILTNAENK